MPKSVTAKAYIFLSKTKHRNDTYLHNRSIWLSDSNFEKFLKKNSAQNKIICKMKVRAIMKSNY